jgi:hypothetical protein
MCSEIVGVGGESCRQLDLSSCPLHWAAQVVAIFQKAVVCILATSGLLQQGDHRCAPPLGARGPCNEPISLDGMSAQQVRHCGCYFCLKIANARCLNRRSGGLRRVKLSGNAWVSNCFWCCAWVCWVWFSGEADVELSLVVPRAPQHDYTEIDA